MVKRDPGSPKYEDSDRITKTSANGAGSAGDALAVGANGVVLADGSNGFAGIQGANPPKGGGAVAVQIHGVVVANATGSVKEGQTLVPNSNAKLKPKTDGSGNPVMAGPGEIRAESDAVSGVAEVYVP